MADKGDAFANLEEWGDRRMEESQHPGGELAILISARFYFDMIRPADVVEKYAPDAVLVLSAAARPRRSREVGSRRLLPLTKVIQTPGVLLVSVRSYVNACCYLISIIHEPCAAVFAAMKFSISAR